MTGFILSFWQAPEGFLGSEWLASAVGIAITYVVFVMGIPSLIFQTFIPEAFRYIYNERFSNEWKRFFSSQLILAVILFLVSDTKIYSSLSWFLKMLIFCQIPEKIDPGHWISRDDFAEGIIAVAVTFVIILIIHQGFNYLINNFQSTRNIAQQIAEKIRTSAIHHYALDQTIPHNDIEDLITLAKELKSGQIKNQFLEECEKIIEFILKHPNAAQSPLIINRLLGDVVCQSVTYDGGLSNQENRRKVLQILNLVYGHIMDKKNINTQNDYDKTLIGYYFREVGVAAMNHHDTDSGIEVIEQLYTIDADPKETFTIGNHAFRHKNHEITVAALHKLKSKAVSALQSAGTFTSKERRILFNWIGLLAKIYQNNGAGREYATSHWHELLRAIGPHQVLPMDLTRDTYKYFYRLADFETADAVHFLEQNLPAEGRG